MMNNTVITGVQRGCNGVITGLIIWYKTRITGIASQSYRFYVFTIYIPEQLESIESQANPVISVKTDINEPRCNLVIFDFSSVTTPLFICKYYKCNHRDNQHILQVSNIKITQRERFYGVDSSLILFLKLIQRHGQKRTKLKEKISAEGVWK